MYNRLCLWPQRRRLVREFLTNLLGIHLVMVRPEHIVKLAPEEVNGRIDDSGDRIDDEGVDDPSALGRVPVIKGVGREVLPDLVSHVDVEINAIVLNYGFMRNPRNEMRNEVGIRSWA